MALPAPSIDNGPGALTTELDLPLRRRLISPRAAMMLLRNTLVSCTVFALGLVLLWLLVQKLGVNAYGAVAVSFFAANSTHYALARTWIFPGSSRNLRSGYLYFFLNAGMGLAGNMALFALFTEVAGLNYLVARVVASLFAGLAMFAANALLNFRML